MDQTASLSVWRGMMISVTTPVTARETSSAEKAMETPPLTAHAWLLRDAVSLL